MARNVKAAINRGFRKKAAPKKKKPNMVAILSITAIAIALVVFVIWLATSKQSSLVFSDGGDRLIACQEADEKDPRWRWYTATPSAARWKLFSVGRTMCIGTGKKWRQFRIDRKELKRYGCVAYNGTLICRFASDPTKHPRYEAFGLDGKG